MKAIIVAFFALVCALVPLSGNAITYIAPHDPELIKAARSIVIATAEASYDELTPDGRIVTLAELRVEESLKGNLKADRLIRLREIGGTIGDVTLTVPGSPRYVVGNRYLVFVGVNNHEEFCTAGMSVGQFVFEIDANGHSILQRAVADGSADFARDADAFLAYIQSVVAGEGPQPNYWIQTVGSSANPVSASRFSPTTFFLRADYLMSGNPRWQNPTANFVTFGSEAGIPNVVSITTSAAGAWTGAGANINYTVSGTTTKHGGLETNDNINEVLFDDPNGTVAALRTSCGCGVIAVGGQWTTASSYSLGGETFAPIVHGDVEVGTSLGLASNQFQAAMTHEFGHTLGFRHSDGTSSNTSPPPACQVPSPCAAIGAAIMASAIPSNITTTLKQWDLDAATTVYGSGGCTAPSVSVQPAGSTITQGQSANMNISATGTATLTYQWYTSPKGDVSAPVVGQTSSSITVSPSSTTTYWVRVTNSCGSADSNTATVTVNPVSCTAPQITSQPTGSTITFGSSAQLSVTASGTSLAYQWYTGAKGNTTSPVFNATTATIGVSPQATTSYWVRVTNSCGTADSNAATVTVNCLAPQVSVTPGSRTITQGSSTIFSAIASGGPNMTFQWYQGIAPDTSNPVSGQTGTSITVSPSTSTSYWVQATVPGCGTASSNTVSVTVNPNNGCAPVTIATPTATQNGASYTLTTSASSTAGGVTITWYQQTNSGQIAIGTGASISVSPTVTTAYLAQAQNSCGSTNSATVTVTIGPSGCTAPNVIQPSDQTIGLGSSTTITVTASGSGTLHYQWYKGAAGDTSVPVGTDSATLITGPLTSNSAFWVKVTNDCSSSTSSVTITVSVEPARHRSVRHR